jgi:hypothetical protein
MIHTTELVSSNHPKILKLHPFHLQENITKSLFISTCIGYLKKKITLFAVKEFRNKEFHANKSWMAFNYVK